MVYDVILNDGYIQVTGSQNVVDVEFVLEHVSKIFFKHIYAPLSGLPWKTEICRPYYLKLGSFRIRPSKSDLTNKFN